MQNSRRTGQLKDEVYRQMFRLEEGRPGAKLGVALALLRAWIAAGSECARGQDADWLRKVSPLCLQMIDAAEKAAAATACPQ